MSSERRKPRHPPEVPGGGTEIVRELHGKIQEGYDLIKTLRTLLGETRKASAQLDAALARFNDATSEDSLNNRLEPVISGVVDRTMEAITQIGDAASCVLSQREQQLIEVITSAAGIESVAELTKAVATLICDQVLEAIWAIKQDREDQQEAVGRFVELVPDLAELLGQDISKPAPPPKFRVKKGPSARSRNQRRR